MKKRVISVICLVVSALFIMAGCSFDSSSENVKYKIVDGEAQVVSLPTGSTVTDIVIPDEYEGAPVTKICDFSGCNLESAEVIHIGKNVKEIGSWAFTNNQKLKEFDVSEENEYYCSVDGVLYNEDVTELISFPNANSKSYAMPDSVKIISDRAFYRCSDIESVAISANVKEIGEKAFFRCPALGNVTLPEGIEKIGKDAFGNCSAMTEITIPSSITEIGEYAFFNCTELLKVTVERAESEITLGEKWYPTNNGISMDKLEIVWPESEK